MKDRVLTGIARFFSTKKRATKNHMLLRIMKMFMESVLNVDTAFRQNIVVPLQSKGQKRKVDVFALLSSGTELLTP